MWFYLTEGNDEYKIKCCTLLDTKDGLNIYAQKLERIEQSSPENHIG